MRRLVLASVLFGLTQAFVGCAGGEDPGGTGATGGTGGQGGSGNGGSGGEPLKTLAAEDLCDELAAIACDADQGCCDSPAAWPGTGEGETQPASCTTTQLAACRGGLGKLAQDPRTGYDAKAAASLVNQLRSAANGCWEDKVDYASVVGIFTGTGTEGASCTPESTNTSGLQLASLSCATELGCEIYLNASGEARGRCEARAEGICSHPLDCAADAWCDASGWKPGVTGHCNPLKANGWDCASDSQCESQYCDAAGRCAATSPGRMCLTQPYASEVETDEPNLYFRMAEASGSMSDASGQGHSGTRMGDPEALSPGALTEDGDAAMAFDGVDDGVEVAQGTIDASGGLAIELWFSFPETTFGEEGSPSYPILTFGEGETLGVAAVINTNGELYVNLRDTLGDDHELINTDKKPSHTDWHHLVINYDGFLAEMYLDGARLASLESVFVPDVSGKLRVGFTDAGSHFKGGMDEFAIYEKALPLGRLLEHRRVAKHGPARTWPVFAWFQ
ncbi:MAG: LamG domain-containing protein [Polyangiaceae bacterium]